MRRFALQTALVVLFVLPPCILAQQPPPPAPHPGYEAQRGTSSPNPQADPDPLKDFKRAMAVQAFADQPARFHDLATNTENARRRADAFYRLVADSKTSSDYYSQATALELAVEDAQFSLGSFLRSFSGLQRSGLKKQVHRLWNADSDVTKKWESLQKELKRGKADKRLANAATKLSLALAKLHSEQLAIAKEMGLLESS